jgi:DNA-binding IclR family transcriptional regulator
MNQRAFQNTAETYEPETGKTAAPVHRGRGDSSMHRGLEIITLIREDRPQIRVDDIIAHMGCSQASAYRYLDALGSIGLVTAVGGGFYGIGPRVVELDRILQRTDPMVRCSREVMRNLAAAQPNSLVRLCGLHGDTVICLHVEGSGVITAAGAQVELVYERGMTVSLFHNAASLAILASLPPSRAQHIYLDHAERIREAGMGTNWKAFRANLNGVRRQGFASTVGRNNAMLAAVSVPVAPPEGAQGYGSLSRIFPRDWLETRSMKDLVPDLKDGSRTIEAAMAEIVSQ